MTHLLSKNSRINCSMSGIVGCFLKIKMLTEQIRRSPGHSTKPLLQKRSYCLDWEVMLPVLI